MKKTLKLLAGALLVGVVSLTSCQKYPDGGLKGKAEKRILGTWQLSSYLRNGADETSTLLISDYQETYSEDGVFSRAYTEEAGDAFSETGTYAFTDEKNLDIGGVSSIQDFSPEHSSLSSSTFTITLLKNDEYVYTYNNGGDDHVFSFTKVE